MTEKDEELAPLCKRGHACRNHNIYCRPAFSIDADNFYFINQADDECPYKKRYGMLHTCDCPLRLEIYKRYKI